MLGGGWGVVGSTMSLKVNHINVLFVHCEKDIGRVCAGKNVIQHSSAAALEIKSIH